MSQSNHSNTFSFSNDRPSMPLFKGKKTAQILERFELHCKIDGVKPEHKCEKFALHCSTDIWNQVTSLPAFKTSNWSQFKEELKDAFIDEGEILLYLPSDLDELVSSFKASPSPPRSYGEIMAFRREFSVIADHLKTKGLLSETDETLAFLKGIDDRVREQLELTHAQAALARKVFQAELRRSGNSPSTSDTSDDTLATSILSTSSPKIIIPTLKDLLVQIREMFEATQAFSGGRRNAWMTTKASLEHAPNAVKQRAEPKPGQKINQVSQIPNDDLVRGAPRTSPAPDEQMAELARRMGELTIAVTSLVDRPPRPARDNRDQRPPPRDNYSPATGANAWPQQPRPNLGTCIFCSEQHFKRDCPDLKVFLDRKQLIDNGRICWPDGTQVRRDARDSTMQETVKRQLKSRPDKRPLETNFMTYEYARPSIDLPHADSYEPVARLVDSYDDYDSLGTAFDAFPAEKRGRPSSDGSGDLPKKKTRQQSAEAEEPGVRYRTRRQGAARPTVEVVPPPHDDVPDVDMPPAPPAAKPAKPSKPAQSVRGAPKTKLTTRVAMDVDDTEVTDTVFNTEVKLTMRQLLGMSPDLTKKLVGQCSRRRIPVDDVTGVRAQANALSFAVNDTWYSTPQTKPFYVGTLAYAPVTIRSLTINALLDGGSMVSVISDQLRNKLNLPMRIDGKHRLRGPHGQAKDLLGVCEHVTVEVGGFYFKTHLFVMDRPNNDLILGQPFLFDCRATFDYNIKGGQVMLTISQDDKISTFAVTAGRPDFYIHDIPAVHTDPRHPYRMSRRPSDDDSSSEDEGLKA
jgi:hypothetical protein